MGKAKNNMDWKRFVTIKTKGSIVFVAPNWSEDNFRTKMFRLSRKGYFRIVTKRERRNGGAYGDHFERTDKAWVKGDSPKKPIEYSYPKQKGGKQ